MAVDNKQETLEGASKGSKRTEDRAEKGDRKVAEKQTNHKPGERVCLRLRWCNFGL